MSKYSVQYNAVNSADASAVSEIVLAVLKKGLNNGADGIDVVLGAFSAIRTFVLYNTGPEGVETELARLAGIFKGGERP